MNPSQEPSYQVHDRGDKPYLMLLHGVMSSLSLIHISEPTRPY